MRKNKFNELRSRAETVLGECRKRKSLPGKDIAQLIDELNLYQIELEIQNEDLIKTQLDLEESRSKYIDLYDLAPVGYLSINQEGLIKEINQAGCTLLGLQKGSLINRCFSRYIASEFQPLFSQHRSNAFKNKSCQTYELKLLRWSQPAFYASIESKVIENEHTGYKQLLMFVTDISDRKLAEDSLHLQRINLASIDRLRSLNEFIYGMAQEQNNSLTMIDNYLYGCIRRIESGNYQINDILQILKKTTDHSKMLSDIILNRKISTSKSVFRYENFDINTLIIQTILLLTHESFEYPIIVQYEKSDNLPKVKLDKFHIQQSILNLARNAIEAMKDRKVKEPKLLIEAKKTDQNMIEVTMFDNGPGLSQQLIHQLFEPHFTTKPYGVGLGLSVSRTIIEKHGGQMFALHNPSGGACFGFRLPCVVTIN